MAFLNGIFNTTQNPTELNAKSFSSTILHLFPNGSAPLWAMTNQTGKTKAKATTHGYFSKTMSFVSTTAGAVNNAVVTQLDVASTAGMVAGTVLFNTRTRENVRLTAAPINGTQIAVSRAFGRVAAAATQIGDKWIQAGTAFVQGSDRPVARHLSTVHVPNFTQIFRNAWGLTDTARASYAEAGYSNVSETRKDCSLLHTTDMESALLYGQAKMDTSGAQPISATQGVVDSIYQYAPSNVATAGATTTYSQLIDLVEAPFNYSADIGNSGSRLGFCDRKAMKVITDIGRKSGKVEIMQKETSFGMKFTEFTMYNGTINLIQHPLMNGLDPNAGSMIMIDPAAIKLAYLDGRDAIHEGYGTGMTSGGNGVDGVGGSLTSEFAVECVNPLSCGFVTGLTAGAADV